MFGYEKIQLTLSFNEILLVILILAALSYSVYVYRFTLPPVSKFKKLFLAALRFSSLMILIFVFFEPVLTLEKKIKVEPINLVFIDNSKSIQITDGTNRSENVLRITRELAESELKSNLEFYSFGSEIRRIDKTNFSEKINFNETSTNFSKIFDAELFKDKNVASITVISDGVITEGITPLYLAERLGIPVHTIAIGDSSLKKDISIKNVLYNEYVYAESPTTISTTILNNGFEGQIVTVSLLEENNLIEQQQIVLDNTGINTVSFVYTPKVSGEKKLAIRVSALSGESSSANNTYPFYLNVRSSKVKALIISGSPSPDLTFIKNILSVENNFQVNTLTQVGTSKFIELNPNQKIDSADIFFFLSFPTRETAQELFNNISDKILSKRKPFFIMLNSSVDVAKLSKINKELPVNIQSFRGDYILSQPSINTEELNNPIISNNINLNDWNNLPPVLYSPGNITVKTESKVLAYTKTEGNNLRLPLIISRNFASKRSICFIGKDFWKWKLQTAEKNISLFDNLILNSAKWLSVTDEQKLFSVKTLRKFYSAGDEVEFVAEVYDEAFNPINNADVDINITSGNQNLTTQLSSLGNGLYEGKIRLTIAGDYSFKAEAKIDGKLYKQSSGKFNVGDVDIEMLDTRMNYEFLNTLSLRTNGELFLPSNTSELLKTLRKNILKTTNEKIVQSQIRLWSNEWLLVIAVLLFSIEWFLRKQSGML